MSNIKNPNQQVLKFVKTISVPASTNFFVKESFVSNTGWKWGFCWDALFGTKIRISDVADDFVELFGDKIKAPTSNSHDLHYYELCVALSQDAIIAEFGGGKRLETSPFDMFFLMGKQRKGRSGILDGFSSSFYMRDINGALRDVRIRWSESGGWEGDDLRGWSIGVVPIKGPNNWSYSDRVFFRHLIK